MLRLAAALVPILTSTAFAQAPGEVAPTYAQPPSAPVLIAPHAPIDPMARRLAIGVNFGGYTVEQPDTESLEPSTDFSTAELSIRYRISPHVELEALLSGGRQQLEDGSEGELAMGAVTINARYRFRAEQHWNWWLSAGIGGTLIERQVSTEEERSDATRAHLALGIGLEHRWRQFAIHADARVLAIGQREDEDDLVLQMEFARDIRTAEELTAGQVTLGASLYF
jgi:opacity protein-like surface antigen